MLLILESPSKCSTVAKFLDCKCVATCGHLQTLDSVSDDFVPKYKIAAKKVSQLKPVVASYKQDNIYLACDYDREGEAICAQICEIFGLDVKTTKRIKFHEITKTALERAVANPILVDLNLVAAQRARQIIDWVVGFKVSPVLWANIQSDTTLSAGRCQTPALRIVYDNQVEIDNNERKDNGPVTSLYGMFHKTKYILNQTFSSSESALAFINGTIHFQHIYNRDEPKQTIENAPKPFTTSRLQQSASNQFKFSPGETMKIAQKLYEHGLITYMRTDSDQYSHEFINNINLYISHHYGAEYLNSDHKIVAGEKPHEAIRITDLSLGELDDEWSSREKRLYKLIWTNTVESCMKPAIYSTTRQTISAYDGATFINSNDILIFHGFKIVRGEKTEKPVKVLSRGQIVKYESVYTESAINTKSHLSEARLVNLLEEKGIGRPSTFASLVDKIQEREYVVVKDIPPQMFHQEEYRLSDDGLVTPIIRYANYGAEKNIMEIQPIGKRVVDFLFADCNVGYSSLFGYDFTRELEADLDLVSLGVIKPEVIYKKIGGLVSVTKCLDKDLVLDGSLVLGLDNGIKKGKFGLYTVIDGKNVPIQGFGNRPIENIKKEEIVIKESNIKREISAKLSIRTSKKGDYIFYHTGKKPNFYSLDGFSYDYLTCELSELKSWIKDKYGKY